MAKTLNLVKHSAAVHISSVLTLNQRKIANILLYNSHKEILEDKIHSIKLDEILEALGWSNNSEVTNLIKLDLKALNKFQLEWNILNKDKKNSWGVTTLLADARVEKGYLYYTYSKSLREMLFNPNIYAKLNLIIQKNLKNKHALVLWEYLLESLCSSKVNEITTDDITIEDLRKLLGVTNNKSYDNYAIFKAQALLPALEEINSKSDIEVILEAKREGRKISYVHFTVKRKVPIILSVDEAVMDDVNEDYKDQEDSSDIWIKDHHQKLGLSMSKIINDIKNYGREKVKKAMQLCYNNLTKGKRINSLIAYYSAALKEDWDLAEEDEILQQNTYDKETIEEMNRISSEEKGLALIVKKQLLEHYGIGAFGTWFRELDLQKFDGNTLIIRAPSEFIADRLINHYEQKIFEIINKLEPDIKNLKIKSY